MYTVTFYSFKGGVGRTLALANVGVELARTGRRVLLVDFDLEAPGLDTFGMLRPSEKQPGIVEYTSNFLESGVAPDVRNYVYEAHGVGREDGRLWVMPSGMSDHQYGHRLSRIDWATLYRERKGFLMMEDLKIQWEASFRPDYVLIDSRTGHTDIGGICTRQLPDSVVLFFFPNEQNLTGLKPIVAAIRAENKRWSRATGNADTDRISLHFIMSNVPDLDDEQEILAGLQDRFRQELEYDNLGCVIHRYDSLSLLRQSLFIAERPKSRLAREYRLLLDAITERNVQDRAVVVRALQSTVPAFSWRFDSSESQRLKPEDILKYHGRDGEVLYLLAMDLKQRGLHEQSEMLLNRSIELDFRSPQALLAQAEARLRTDNLERSSIWDEVWQAFQVSELSEDDLRKGIEIIRQVLPDRLDELVEAPACKALADYQWFAISNALLWSEAGLNGALALLSRYGEDQSGTVFAGETIRNQKCLALIGLGRFSEALRLFGAVRPAPELLTVHDAFNYAMAEWGANGEIPSDMFSRVIEVHKEAPSNDTPNYYQCLGIAFWAIGRSKEALESIERAQTQVTEKPTPHFSCWRYMNVNPPGFLKDCAAIRQLISGADVKPLFLQKQTRLL
ncbi:ParA family protein [Anaerobaca lacustris]|uniref:ParA family protein n=1 Tax=Anaerobaca lacustris TaxID=3044600 RepID=A0AAW6TU49_9BACT|nr:ParA family protein [Sedimentisphaerales bacterium M17dextr]